MSEVLRCKVRDIKDSTGRWEIRLERRNLPAQVVALAGKQIGFRLSRKAYQARTGIACRNEPNQYFWINTRKKEAGPIKDILQARGFRPNDDISLLIESGQRIGCLPCPSESRLHNIIDMGLGFSAMIRLFERKPKEKLRDKMLDIVQEVFEAKSGADFQRVHSEFCTWGIRNVKLAERKRNGVVVKTTRPASYGQVAKTFDVVLKVVVYYCHLPDCVRSQQISGWLNAAVDTKMMAMLRRNYRRDISRWPSTIEQVDKSAYASIQRIVHRFISERHHGSITPVEFDDMYWEALNRRDM